MVGNVKIAYPEYPHAEPQAATLYMRPHELDIALKENGVPGLRANVRRVNPTGSVARIGLTAVDHNTEIQVDLSMDRFAELNLKTGDNVFVLPKRVRVFVPEYVI
jgi:sulfate transport system ATP-binding protein